MKNSRTLFAGAGLLLTAAIWGFAFVVVKDSLDYIGPVYMVALRFSVAAVVLAAVSVKKFKLFNKNVLKNGVISGLCLCAAYITQTIGCNFTTAGKNAFLTTFYVILVPLFVWIFYKKRPKWYVFFAAILALTGIGLLALNKGEGNSLLKINKGDVFTLICSIFFAFHMIFTEKANSQNCDTILITIIQFFVTSIFAWILAFFTDENFSLNSFKNSSVIISLFYLGIFSTLIGFCLQNIGLKYLPSSVESLFLSFESVFGVIFSVIFLHEQLSAKMTIGCVLIFLAVIIVQCFNEKGEKS